MSDTNDRSDTSDILVKTCARTPNTFRKKYNLELHDYVQPVYTRTPFQYVRQNERFLHHMPDLSIRMRMMIMDERERERENSTVHDVSKQQSEISCQTHHKSCRFSPSTVQRSRENIKDNHKGSQETDRYSHRIVKRNRFGQTGSRRVQKRRR